MWLNKGFLSLSLHGWNPVQDCMALIFLSPELSEERCCWTLMSVVKGQTWTRIQPWMEEEEPWLFWASLKHTEFDGLTYVHLGPCLGMMKVRVLLGTSNGFCWQEQFPRWVNICKALWHFSAYKWGSLKLSKFLMHGHLWAQTETNEKI